MSTKLFMTRIRINIENFEDECELEYIMDKSSLNKSMLLEVKKLKSSYYELLNNLHYTKNYGPREYEKLKKDMSEAILIADRLDFNLMKKIVLMKEKIDGISADILNSSKENITRSQTISYIKEKRQEKIKDQNERESRISNAFQKIKSKKAKKADDLNQLESTELVVNPKGNELVVQNNKTKGKNKIPWWATIPVVGALAVSFVTGINNWAHRKDKNDKDNYSISEESNLNAQSSSNSYDSIQFTQNDDSILQSQEELSESNSNPDKTTTINMDEQTSTTTGKNKVYETPDGKKITFNDIEKAVEEGLQEQKEVVIGVGDKINVPDGLKYTSDCYGHGKSNNIGSVSWRPATEYSIDRVAYFHNKEFIALSNKDDGSINDTIKKYAKEYGINEDEISTKILISLVSGKADTGWVSMDVKDMQQNKVEKQNNQNKEDKHNDSEKNLER